MERKSALVIDNVPSRRDKKKQNIGQNYSDFSTIQSIPSRQNMDQEVIETIKKKTLA
jgi:hypothetical protein